jgi:hypothetical protein
MSIDLEAACTPCLEPEERAATEFDGVTFEFRTAQWSAI